MKLDELRERLQLCNDEAQAVRAKAEAEKRDLTVEEQNCLDASLGAFDQIQADIERVTKLEEQTELLHKSFGRKTEANTPAKPQEVSDHYDSEATPPRPQRNPRVSAEINRHRGTCGFSSLGEMARSVRMATQPGGRMDPRLEALAPTTWGSEGIGSDGGFAVPPDFRTAIMEKVMGEDSLLSRTDQVSSSSNTLTIPKDETTPWQTSGGIQAYWEGEGQLKTQSKPNLETTTVKLNKIVALVPMTDELLEDAAAMDAYLRRKAPEKIAFKINLAVVQGTGVGQPIGILNSGSLVSVAKQGSQVADTLVANNVLKMWSRMYAPLRSGAIWLINQDIEPMLHSLSMVGRDDTGTVVTEWGSHVYLPANGLSGSPYGTLFGRPVVPTQACETLGDKGDIILVNLMQYLTVLKAGPNPRVDVSMHLYFDYDMTAYRFVLRVGGQPWWGTSISPRDGSNTLSWAVTLDERA